MYGTLLFEQEAENLFGHMREATEEEIRMIQKSLDNISEPTGFNIFDIIDGGDIRGKDSIQ